MDVKISRSATRRDLADRIVGRRPRARRFAVGDRCAARADAFTYWNLIGLSVKPDRLTQVHVDGGGEISADAGTGETCLDVEQSGGLAPGAKVIVYDAPNSDAGFIDLFYKAASDNLVDTMSCSWGLAEAFLFPEVVGVDNRPQIVAAAAIDADRSDRERGCRSDDFDIQIPPLSPGLEQRTSDRMPVETSQPLGGPRRRSAISGIRVRRAIPLRQSAPASAGQREECCVLRRRRAWLMRISLPAGGSRIDPHGPAWGG